MKPKPPPPDPHLCPWKNIPCNAYWRQHKKWDTCGFWNDPKDCPRKTEKTNG